MATRGIKDPFSIFTITNWERRHYALNFLKAMSSSTFLNISPLTIIENGDSSGEDLEQFLKENSGITNFNFVKFSKREGLARVWNWCMISALYEWVIICNDDCIPVYPWEVEVNRLIEMHPHQMFLLCHPNGFSAFCLHRQFWQKHKYFNGAFPEGYYEDDDWFLKVCFQEEVDKAGVFKKFIFSYYDSFGEGLFVHQPEIEGISYSGKKWDKKANQDVFFRFWEETAPNTRGAVENKNGRWFKPKFPVRRHDA